MILSHDDETIIALCTPQGKGAIAVLRMSGLYTKEIGTAISKLASGKSIKELPSHTIQYGGIVDADGNRIDQVLFMLMWAPHSFTGQDVLEITCHNNPFIIQQIIEQALAHGARLAKEGEFAKRAVLNNKIDLIQAEAINELLQANTQAALKKSLAQLEGSLSQWLVMLEKSLVKALALSDASFEFIDEEMSFDQEIKTILANALTTIEQIKKTFDQQTHMRQGIRIAIIGSVNAGKSSLFNALLNKERAIVTNIAGTTRDVIEAGMYKNNNYWTLIDTAGLRQTNDIVEQEGIKRSYQEAQKADIIIVAIDRSTAMSNDQIKVYNDLLQQFGHKTITVYTKTDLPVHPATLAVNNALSVCITQKATIQALEQHIETSITNLLHAIESPFLLNQRQFNLLLSLETRLRSIYQSLQKPLAYELLSYDLTDALAHITELTGKSISEQGMDAIFKEFCIGK